MKASIASARREDVEHFIRESDIPLAHIEMFFKCFQSTTQYWVGHVEREIVCIYGIIPPTLASDTAYLWLYTTAALEGNEFLFVRHSQRAVEELLKIYPVIVGHATVGASRSIRWLRWLGAVFKEPQGELIPFNIKAKVNG